MKLHLQILEEGHDEMAKGECETSLVEMNKQNHVTERQGQGLLDTRNQPATVVEQAAPDEDPNVLLACQGSALVQHEEPDGRPEYEKDRPSEEDDGQGNRKKGGKDRESSMIK